MRYLILSVLIFGAGTAHSNIYDSSCNDLLYKKAPCIILLDGKEVRIYGTGEISLETVNSRLILQDGFRVDWLRDAMIYKGNGYLSFDISDSDAGSSIVFSISLTTGILNWQTEFGSFNVSKLLIRDHGIYLGSIGRVGKLHIGTGKVEWIHTNLYERDTQAYNSFFRPYELNENIIFPEEKVSTAKYSGTRKVVVNKKTGEIVEK